MAVHQPDLGFLEKQVESIRAQSYPGWQLLLVLDGPHPELDETIGHWKQQDSRIRSEVLTDHSGCCRTFETGLRRLKGTDCLIALADQDDIWHPRKLEALRGVFERDPDTLMAFCDSCIIDESDQVIAHSLHQSEERVPAFGLASLMARNSISGHSQLFRSSLLEHAVPFPDGLPASGLHHDHWLAMVAASTGSIVFLRETLVMHRLHRENQIGPRTHRDPSKADGFSAWCRQNAKLRNAIASRHRMIHQLPGSSASRFNRRHLLGLAARAITERNLQAAAIYLRASCAPRG
jgi:glycosyltransferase involved in cell wall biosynthesis